MCHNALNYYCTMLMYIVYAAYDALYLMIHIYDIHDYIYHEAALCNSKVVYFLEPVAI